MAGGFVGGCTRARCPRSDGVDAVLCVFFIRGQDALAPGCPRSYLLVIYFICGFVGTKIGGEGGGWCANLHFCAGFFCGGG